MKLGEAIKIGLAKKTEIDDNEEYTIAGVQSYGKGIINRRTVYGKNLKMKKYQVIEENYLMWCKVDTKNGAFGLTKKEHIGSLASTNMALAKIDTKRFNPEFIERLFSFKFFYGYITHLSSGTTNRKYLTPKQLLELIDIPLLSKNEQDEFINLANKIENLNISTELSHQLDLVKQLRQSFLREAMQGRFDFAQQPDADKETGAELLAKIKAEKALRQAQGHIRKQKPLSPITKEEIPFEIPENWVWCRLGEVVNIKSGKRIHAEDYRNTGIPFLRSGEIGTLGRGEIIKNQLYISDDKYLSIKEKFGIPKEGDILIACIGGSIGNTWVVDNRAFYYKDGNLVLIESIDKIETQFLLSYLKSPFFWNNTILSATDSSYNALTIVKLNDAEFPLPPLSKQKAIVKKLDELMAYCDSLEQSIKNSQSQNEMLLQQVLCDALEPKELEVVG
jgi:type I restriction enzyme S subunit